MKKYRLPTGPRPAPLPLSVAFQLATACPEPPAGEGWFYEVKHDGHRIAAITGQAACACFHTENSLKHGDARDDRPNTDHGTQ